MSSVARRLRRLADELEAEGVTLVPVPATAVVVGDLIRPRINERLVVESIAVLDRAEDRKGGPLLKFAGRMLESPFGQDFPSSHNEWADQWVVVER